MIYVQNGTPIFVNYFYNTYINCCDIIMLNYAGDSKQRFLHSLAGSEGKKYVGIQ